LVILVKEETAFPMGQLRTNHSGSVCCNQKYQVNQQKYDNAIGEMVPPSSTMRSMELLYLQIKQVSLEGQETMGPMALAKYRKWRSNSSLAALRCAGVVQPCGIMIF